MHETNHLFAAIGRTPPVTLTPTRRGRRARRPPAVRGSTPIRLLVTAVVLARVLGVRPT
jgi:hypothetical protein